VTISGGVSHGIEKHFWHLRKHIIVGGLRASYARKNIISSGSIASALMA